ncbi:MAG: radical SAM protein [Thermodesulfobacteriota bacterium]
MKVVLLQPPARDFYDTQVRLQPLGLAYLKAAVQVRVPGAEVVVRDFRQGWGRRTVALPRELAHLREYYPFPDQSPFSTFHGYYHFGAGFEELAAEVAAEEPDLVGISAPFSAYYREALACAEAIRRRRPVPVVAGGAHASALPESLLRSPGVDFAILGEGERPLVELVRTLAAGGDLGRVPNLAFRRDGMVVRTPREPNFPLAELPPPDLSDLSPVRYRLGRKPLAAVLSSRGCPRRCSFCAVHTVFQEGYRRRPAGDVAAELRVRWDAGYRAFDFEDDNLTADREGAAALFRALLAAFGEGTLALHAMNGVSWDALDPELLGLMARTGFSHLNLSLVSGSPEACRGAGRAGDRGAFQEVVEAAAALGLRVVAYQILGLPGEDPSGMAEALAYLGRLPVLIGASPFYLPPGSPLARGRPEPDEAALVRARLTALGADPDPGARDAVYTLFVTARILNFLKGLPTAGARVPLARALTGARAQGVREALGAELLERLLADRVLLGASGEGLRPLPRFRFPVFSAAWSALGWVGTQDKGRLDLC